MKPTFKVILLVNNEAGKWTSWPDKIKAIRDFYAPVCDLSIDFASVNLAPRYSEFGTSGVMCIDESWYEQHVAPVGKDGQFIIFVVPASDHIGMPTLGGLEAGHPAGPWEMTVFTQGESAHAYQNGIDLGDLTTLLACHELSHAFYAMLTGINGGPGDNTHKYFYGANPAGIYQDLHFESDINVLYARLRVVMQELEALKKKLI